MQKLTKWKKISLALKVFVPILVKGIIQLFSEICDAYDDYNQYQIEKVAEQMEKCRKDV